MHGDSPGPLRIACVEGHTWDGLAFTLTFEEAISSPFLEGRGADRLWSVWSSLWHIHQSCCFSSKRSFYPDAFSCSSCGGRLQRR